MKQTRYENEFGITHVPAKDQVLDMQLIEDEEWFSKRIILRQYKERQNKRQTFDPEVLKNKFLSQLADN